MSGSKREDSADRKNRRVRKPPNAFLLFSNSRRHALALANPSLSASKLSQLLGKEWNDLPEEEKEQYFETAKLKRQEFMRENPGYSFSTQKKSPEAAQPGKRSWSLESRWPLLNTAQGRTLNVPTSVTAPTSPQLQPQSYRPRMPRETYSFESSEHLAPALSGLSTAQSEAFQRMMGVAAPTAHYEAPRPLEHPDRRRPISVQLDRSSSHPYSEPSLELSVSEGSQSARSPVRSHTTRSPYVDVPKLRPDAATAPLLCSKPSSALVVDSDLSTPLGSLAPPASHKRRRVGLFDSPSREDSLVPPFGPSGSSPPSNRFFSPSSPLPLGHTKAESIVRDVTVAQRRDRPSHQSWGGLAPQPPQRTPPFSSCPPGDSRSDLVLAPFSSANSSRRSFPSSFPPGFDDRNAFLEPLPSICSLLQNVSSSRSSNTLPSLRSPAPSAVCSDSDVDRDMGMRSSATSSASSRETQRDRDVAFHVRLEHERDASWEQHRPQHLVTKRDVMDVKSSVADDPQRAGKRLRDVAVADSSSDVVKASRTPPDVNFDWLSLPPLSVPRLLPCSFHITSA